jgi:Uma2 family endonuclease
MTHGPHGQDQLLTVEEWADLPEDVQGELVDGRLVEEEVVRPTHAIVATWLTICIGTWARERGGYVLGDLKLRIAARRGRIPDLCIYLPEQARPRRDDALVTRLPSIVIEIVSPERSDTRRDRVEKTRDYADAGIPWYWIVDPQQRVLEIYELGRQARYFHALGAAQGVIAEVPGCEGLALDLDALWAEIDAFSDEQA